MINTDTKFSQQTNDQQVHVALFIRHGCELLYGVKTAKKSSRDNGPYIENIHHEAYLGDRQQLTHNGTLTDSYTQHKKRPDTDAPRLPQNVTPFHFTYCITDCLSWCVSVLLKMNLLTGCSSDFADSNKFQAADTDIAADNLQVFPVWAKKLVSIILMAADKHTDKQTRDLLNNFAPPMQSS
jgi:hypothetical protein